MEAITQIGEASIEFEGKEYIFRPSFKAIQSIGGPEEILDILNKLVSRDTSVFDAIAISDLILDRTCTTEFPSHLFPSVCLSYDGKREVVRQAKVNIEVMMFLAADVLAMGVCGKSKEFKEKPSGKLKSFDAAEYVGCIVGQLGIPPDVAWNMTMIEMQRAFESKYPNLYVSDDAPSLQDYQQLCDEIDRRKAIKKGAAK